MITKKKLKDKLYREGHLETNRFIYKMIGADIWRKSKEPGTAWIRLTKEEMKNETGGA